MGAVLASLLVRFPDAHGDEAKYENGSLPKCMFMQLGEECFGDRDLIVVGDVHGCLEELQELTRLVELKYGRSVVYLFVGDIVAKGPKSVETLRFVRNLDAFVVRGNHEERIIKEWKDFKSGRISQFDDKFAWMKDLTDDDMRYMMELPYVIVVPSRSLMVVHGGLSPFRHLFHQRPRDMITMRSIVGMDVIDPRASQEISDGVPWGSVWPGPCHVYFGHDARRRLQVYPYATGLDTGCVYGGSLTAVNASLPGTSILSVPAKSIYKRF